MGTLFPGEGTIYLSQSLNFKRPMYTGVAYKAKLIVKEIDVIKNTAVIETVVVDTNSGKVVISGEAAVMNKTKIS
jgi:acyl dehydratase